MEADRILRLPTSLTAIMRNAKPAPRREQWTRQESNEELDPNPDIKEQPPGDSDLWITQSPGPLREPVRPSLNRRGWLHRAGAEAPPSSRHWAYPCQTSPARGLS